MSEELESIRRGIDRVDVRIVKLLRKRNVLMTAAGKLEDSQKGMSVSKRVDAILTKIHALAEKEGLDPNIAVTVYKTLINCFIEKELNELKGISKNPPKCNCYFCQEKRK